MDKKFLFFFILLILLIVIPYVNGGAVINITSPIADQINNRIVLINISFSPSNATILYNFNGTNISYTDPVYQSMDYGLKKLIVFGNDTATGLSSVTREFNVRLEYQNGLGMILGLILLMFVFIYLAYIFEPKTIEANNTSMIYAFKSFFIIMALGTSIAILNVSRKLIAYEFEEKQISDVITSLSTMTTWVMIFLLIYFVIWYISLMLMLFYKKFIRKETKNG